MVAGKAEGILDLLEDLGPVPERLREEIYAISDLKTLKKLLKLAAKSSSLAGFERDLAAIIK